jgi:hypothetical protein
MHIVSFPFEMGGGLDTECIRPPPGRMWRKISANMNRHIPSRSHAGGITPLHRRMFGNAGRAIKPPDALPTDFGVRQRCRLSGKQQYCRRPRHAADHQAEENILRVLGVHRALLEKVSHTAACRMAKAHNGIGIFANPSLTFPAGV